MASEKDVVVGSVWRWTPFAALKILPSHSGCPFFTIVARDARVVDYVYSCGGAGSRPPEEIAKWARPVAVKCAAGCTPATPCQTEGACPVFEERSVACTNWFGEQGDWASYDIDCLESGLPAPELRCEREWGCGLVRSRR